MFYAKISNNAPSVQALSWTLMKSKMRNLKTSYLKAVSWKGQTGAGLLAEGNESSVTEYIHKMCPYWECLEQIFGQRRNVNPAVVIDTSSSSYEEKINEADPLCCIVESYSVDQFDEEQDITTIDEDVSDKRDVDANPNDPPTPSTSGMNFTAFKNQLKIKPSKKNRPTSNSGCISLLVDIQEKKLKFEETKWNKQMQLEEERVQLDRLRAENEMELKRMEMLQQLEMKKLELEKEERLAVTKMKLDAECSERVKKYELDLKANKHV